MNLETMTHHNRDSRLYAITILPIMSFRRSQNNSICSTDQIRGFRSLQLQNPIHLLGDLFSERWRPSCLLLLVEPGSHADWPGSHGPSGNQVYKVHSRCLMPVGLLDQFHLRCSIEG